MRITNTLTDEAVLLEIGHRLARTRLERNLSQAQLAFEAGVSLPTLRRLEDGRPVNMTTLIRLLRALQLLGGLEVSVPEAIQSPIERLRLRGKPRQRARPRADAERPKPGGWSWGDAKGVEES
jgi:transcriptional regulator with XRE-family HTH domain